MKKFIGKVGKVDGLDRTALFCALFDEYDILDCKQSWELDPPKKAVEIVKLLNSYECERVNSKGETALMAGINNIVEFQHVFAPLFKDQLGM